ELADVLALWSASHAALRDGDDRRLLLSKHSPQIGAALADIEPYVARMTTAAEKLGAAADRSADEDVLHVLLANEGEFLTRMDRIVGLYEDEARGRAARLLWIGWIVTALIIIAFAAIGRFVLMPAT